MAHVIVCDVCENQVSKKEWEADPGIEATIPQALMGDVGEPLEATFCSWGCLAKISAHYAKEMLTEPTSELDLEDSDTEADPEPEPIRVTPSAAAVGQHFEMPQVRIKR